MANSYELLASAVIGQAEKDYLNYHVKTKVKSEKVLKDPQNYTKSQRYIAWRIKRDYSLAKAFLFKKLKAYIIYLDLDLDPQHIIEKVKDLRKRGLTVDGHFATY